MQDLPRELDDADSLTRRVSHQHAFLQASRRLAQGPAADTELLGPFRLADACPWSQLARDHGLCKVRKDTVRERPVGPWGVLVTTLQPRATGEAERGGRGG